jgi:hypothetical protein
MSSSGSGVMVTIGGDATSLTAAVNQGQNALAQLNQAGNAGGQGMNLLNGALGQLGGAFNSVIGFMGNFINNALQMATGMGLYNFFDSLTSKAYEFGQQMFDLNNTMERYQTSWEYLFGTGNNAQSATMAQNLANWTKVQSYNYPFTRQDMLGAINAAGMGTQDPNLIKEYLPAVADIAATRTNMMGQPVTLQQAMMSLVQANMGYSRMLKYDLKINPNELKKYGWNEKGGDFANLMQALQKYDAAHNLTGAAQHIATSTFYGEESSFMDRIQNFQLEAGQGLFKGIKGDLNSFTAWWDAHQTQLNQFADFLGGKVASALHTVSNAAKDFAVSGFNAFTGKGGVGGGIFGELGGIAGTYLKNGQQNVGAALSGFTSGGGLQAIAKILDSIRRVLADPNIQKGEQIIAHLLGLALGAGLSAAATVLGKVADVITFIAGNKTALDGVLTVAMIFAGFIAGEMVEAFVAWAVAMGTAAVAEAAVMWPVYLAVAAIAALTFGIIELVQHWKDVTEWLGHVKDALGHAKDAVVQFVVHIAQAIAQNGIFKFLIGMMAVELGFLWTVLRDIVEIYLAFEAAILRLIVSIGRWVGGVVQAITQSTQFRIAVDALRLAWKNIQDEWDKAWTKLGQIASQLGHVKDVVAKWAGDLLQNALTWGEDLIKNIADGITSGIHHLEDALNSVTNKIKSFLGHSVPKEGPLVDELTWMPHMMQNFAGGITANIPLLAQATSGAANAIAQNLGPNSAVVGGAYGAGSNYSTVYGDESATININAATEARVGRVLDAALRSNNRMSNLRMRQPGGFRRFGAIGV